MKALAASFPLLLGTVAVLASGLAAAGDGAAPSPEAAQPPVNFDREIRPILSEHCFACHGPDEKKRQDNLRLDQKDSVLADRGGYQVVVPGDRSKSELYLRISSDDEEFRMPPAESGEPPLTKDQIERIGRWIDQGASWQGHWSFVVPERPPLPEVKNKDWPRNPIDFFVLARLEREGLAPSPEADRTTLIRRVTLDLTGLPPTPQEVDAFLADDAPDAYEKVVDRLLASPRYGERMALEWLDAARYADTNGYQTDGPRDMWRWRDWVIDAYNRNMPFNQFTVEQLGGDLLPDATMDQRVATGFNRNHRGNSEGGIIPEEFQVEYVVDRVDTTATVWLGLTMGCARCHDHKFDPLSQREFYQIFAFFNNIPEYGRALKDGNSPPMIKAPTPEMQKELADLQGRLAAAREEFEKLAPELDAAQTAWENSLAPGGGAGAAGGLPTSATSPINWSITDGLVAHYELDSHTVDTSGQYHHAAFESGTAAYAPGQLGQAADFDGMRFINAGDVAKFGFFDKFSIGAWVHQRGSQGGTIVSRMMDSPRAEGYSIRIDDGRVHVDLVKRWLDDAVRVATLRQLQPDRWYHVMVTYDGSRFASGIKVYVNGQEEELKVHLDALNQSFVTTEPLRIGAGGGPDSHFHGYLDDVRVYSRRPSPDEVETIATVDSITDIVATSAENRTPQQARKLRAYFLEEHSPEPIRAAKRNVLALAQEEERLADSFPSVMVMQEMDQPRDTFVLVRGQYDRPSEKVPANVPSALPPLPSAAPKDRLGFAQWLVDPSNPLTARVAVNRYWQMYFGTGIIATAEDFGVQGEPPSHPELLDWLATEYLRTGWNTKALQRLIVTSATYRQSSKSDAALVQKDPGNRLLAHGPRLRLSAHAVRDQALALGGVLIDEVGGPSVKPYQPEGLWEELSGNAYTQDHGEKLYRRSLYTYWKRTVTPPSMATFDAASRESCVVRRPRTNTPLQALVLMNDVTFVEASRSLAARILNEGGTTPQERIRWAFRLATSREPSGDELAILLQRFDERRAHYRDNTEAAAKLVHVGESPVDDELDACDLAAYTAVANVIFNLDEVVTKE